MADAAEKLIGVIFHQSPRKSVYLLKGFIELGLVGYQSSLIYLLEKALEADNPPVLEVLHTTVELVLPFIQSSKANLAKSLLIRAADEFNSEVSLDIANYLVERSKVDMLHSLRPAWNQAVALGLEAIGHTPEETGLQLSDLNEIPNSSSSDQIDRRLCLKSGECLEADEVLNRIHSAANLKAVIEEEEKDKSFFHWDKVIEHLSHKVSTSNDLKELENVVKSSFSADTFQRSKLARMLLSLSKRLLELGDTSSAWALAEQALDVTEASGWDPYYDGSTRHRIVKHLTLINAEKGRKKAIKLYSEDGSKGLIPSYGVVLKFDSILELLLEEVPTIEIWKVLEEYLDELFGGVPVVLELPPELKQVMDMAIIDEDTPNKAVADFLSLHLDHPSYTVSQGAVRACTYCLLKGSTGVTTAVKEAFNRTEQSAERALMVLDAASRKETASINSFKAVLEQLRISSNFLIRFLSSHIWAACMQEELGLNIVQREIPSVYSLELPSISRHRTEKMTMQEDDSAVLIQDPALELRPFDIEARAIARITEISEDNVLYQSMKYLYQFKDKRTWLAEFGELDQEIVSRFLDKIGLRHTCQKPHIAITRQALSHVCADLFDSGYFSLRALLQLPDILIYHDPEFILNRPIQRPSYIKPIGGLSINSSSFVRKPENWLESTQDSMSLLSLRMFDDRIVLGEWTRLKYLDDETPNEERISIIRAVESRDLWKEFDIRTGHCPFARFVKCQVGEYLALDATPDHLIISGEAYGFDTPGSPWIAFNPYVARVLGWHLLEDGWFRWANQSGDLVAESLWWNDGPVHQHSEYVRSEVGYGWLVLVTEQGFKEVSQFTGQLSRGGVIRRRLGEYGANGEETAISVLPLS